MDNKDIMSRFVILEDPIDLTWTVFHESGIPIGDNFPTFEDAFAAMVRADLSLD